QSGRGSDNDRGCSRMAVNVGNLAAFISADSSALTGGLGAAGKKFSGFVGGITGFASKILPIGAAIGGLVGTIKSVTNVARQFSEVDSIAKFSRAVGISTEEMVGLEHAARLSGVEIGTLRNGIKRARREG